MILQFKHGKKIIATILMFVMLLVANLGLIISTSGLIKSASALEVLVKDSITIDNGTFSNSDGNDYPTNFTFTSTNSTTKRGVINIEEDYEDYGLLEDELTVPNNATDKHCVVIDSQDSSAKGGWTSKEFTFSKSGNYYVSVYVYTLNVDGSASLYLYKGSEVFASITGINTRKSWKEYTFMVTTNDYEDLTLSLGLWLGSSSNATTSCVFFDEINAGKISADIVNTYITEQGLDGKTTFYNNGLYYKDLANDFNLFECDLNATNFVASETGNENVGNASYTSAGFIEIDNEDVLKILNKQANKTCYESVAFDLEINKVYKFTMKIKVVSGSAYMRIKETVEDSPKSSEDLVISSTTNKFDNDYVECSIIVKSDALANKNVKLYFGVGGADAVAGEAYFKDFVLSSVTTNRFSNVAEGKEKAFDFTSNYSTSSTVTNFGFDFNEVTKVSLENEQPLNEAKSWTTIKAIGYADNQNAGVFNVKDYDKLIKTDFPTIHNPGFITGINDTTNNILMLHSAVNQVVSSSSATFTLTKESYYKLSMYVQTQVSDDNVGASIVINTGNEDDSYEIARLDNINTTGWELVTLYIKSAYQDITPNITLSLGNENAKTSGYAFFDIVKLETIESSEYVVGNNSYDLTKPISINNTTPVLFDFNGEGEYNADLVSNEIVDLDGDMTVLPYEDRESAKSGTGDTKALYIGTDTQTGYYHFDSKLKYSMVKDSYYKLSVDVFTSYLQAEDDKAGASISISDIEDSSFTLIDTAKEWKTYTFYIAPDSDVTSTLSMGLGTSENNCCGKVLFKNIAFEKLADKAAYQTATEDLDEYAKTVGTVVVDDEEETTNNSKDKNEINWVLLTSTFTAVAVIVAVLGVAVKKLFKPGKKKVRKSRVDYDRDGSVLRQKYHKLAVLKRDKDIRGIEKRVQVLNDDRASKEIKYKELLSKVRELKLKNRDGKLNGQLKVLNNELSKASRNVSKTGVMINKLNSQVAFMRTAGYLQGLERQLVKQDEFAKAKGTTIEEILKNEEEIVFDDIDTSVDDALSKADEMIEQKKEEERLEAERREQERLEQERIAKEEAEEAKYEAERLELARIEAERKEAQRLEEERLEKELNIQPVKTDEDIAVSSENDTQGESSNEQTTESSQETAETEQTIEEKPVETDENSESTETDNNVESNADDKMENDAENNVESKADDNSNVKVEDNKSEESNENKD